jgi:hypothetical protein
MGKGKGKGEVKPSLSTATAGGNYRLWMGTKEQGCVCGISTAFQKLFDRPTVHPMRKNRGRLGDKQVHGIF